MSLAHAASAGTAPPGGQTQPGGDELECVFKPSCDLFKSFFNVSTFFISLYIILIKVSKAKYSYDYDT